MTQTARSTNGFAIGEAYVQMIDLSGTSMRLVAGGAFQPWTTRRWSRRPRATGITMAALCPKNMMEIHEMVLDTVGGVRFGMPYCTLCGSAQAYSLESVPDGVEPPVLRTSGLLSRSNKVMFDLNTWSAFDTFTGRAVSGPLREAGVVLEQLTVVTATWGAWKKAHPETTIVAQDGGIGRSYSADPLDGRDDFGPILPVGPVDPRLPVQELVLGIETPTGQFIAFPVAAAKAALQSGAAVELAGVKLVEDADGLRAELGDGTPLVSHEAFWFAGSQFHPETEVWSDIGQ